MVVVYKQHAEDADAASGQSGAVPEPGLALREAALPAAARAWVERPTETQRVYSALKRAILAGDLRPGEPLQEIRIAAEFGASRTPIREAFQRLEADGLVAITPRRGAVVLQLTVRDFLDINELRLILEPVVARMAAEIIPASVVEELQARLAEIELEQPDDEDFAALEALDLRMHMTIARSIQNVRLTKIITSLNDMMQIIREKDMRRRHREMHESIAELLGALAARDGERVESLMRRHVGDFSGALRGLVSEEGRRHSVSDPG